MADCAQIVSESAHNPLVSQAGQALEVQHGMTSGCSFEHRQLMHNASLRACVSRTLMRFDLMVQISYALWQVIMAFNIAASRTEDQLWLRCCTKAGKRREM